MAQKVAESPALPTLIPTPSSISTTNTFLGSFIRALFNLLRTHALRLNACMTTDGSEVMGVPLRHRVTTVVGLTAYPAAEWSGAAVMVSDEAGGYTQAFSDGANWRRVQDRAVVS